MGVEASSCGISFAARPQSPAPEEEVSVCPEGPLATEPRAQLGPPVTLAGSPLLLQAEDFGFSPRLCGNPSAFGHVV